GHRREDRPWPEYCGKPITARQMAWLLKPLGIRTNQTVRRSTERGKGYRAQDLVDAFDRYLPPFIGDTVTTRRNPLVSGIPIGDKPDQDGRVVTDRRQSKAAETGTCHRVTDRAAPTWWRDDPGDWPTRDLKEVVWTE